MALISGTQLASARASMEKMLSDTCEHFAKTDTVTASGSTTKGFATQGMKPCLMYATVGRSMGSEIKMSGESVSDNASHVVRLKYDAGVTVGDKLVLGGSEFLVTSDADSDTNRFLLIVGVTRIRGDKF